MSQINVTEYKTLIQNANVEVKVVWCLAEWQTHQGPHQKLEVWLQRSFRPLVESSGLQISAAWIEKCGGVCKLLHAIA